MDVQVIMTLVADSKELIITVMEEIKAKRNSSRIDSGKVD